MTLAETYSRLAALATIQLPPEKQKAIYGLYLTTNVATAFQHGTIDEAEARIRIKAIIESNTIPDPIAVQALSDSLKGSKNLDNTVFDDSLKTFFQVGGIIAAPLFATPAGAITVGLISAYGADAVKYLGDPDNIFTGQFSPPRPNPILLTGAVAAEQLSRVVSQEETLRKIYSEFAPQATSSIKLLDSDGSEQLATSIGGDLSKPIKDLLVANNAQLGQKLDALQSGIYAKLDGLEVTTKEIISALKTESDARERQRRIEIAQRQEKIIQQEVSGAITLVDSFTRFVIGDADKAKKITGCLKAAQSTYQLVSAYIAGSLGPLGLAGGVVGVMQNVFGLFGGGPDPVLAKLEEIEKKLNKITDILIQGFEHLDQRLTDVLNLSIRILNEVRENGQIVQGRLNVVEQKIDHLVAIATSIARTQFEKPIADLAFNMRDEITAGNSIQGEARRNLTILSKAATLDSRESVMNNSITAHDTEGIADLLEHLGDIRMGLGLLPFIVSSVNQRMSIQDINPPDVKFWSYSVQGILELLVAAPGINPDVVKIHISELWIEGNKTKSSILTATCKDFLFSLLDIYEVASIRELSNGTVNATLDELVSEMLESPIAEISFEQHVNNMILLTQAPFFLTTGTFLRFLLSVLTWRVSEVGDNLSVNPRSVDIVSDRLSLSAFIIATISAQTSGEVIEVRDGNRFFTKDIKSTILKALSQKITLDTNKLRSGIATTSVSRRVRDLDEALLGLSAIAISRQIKLDNITIPLLRIPYLDKPSNIYEFDYDKLTNALKQICLMAENNFDDLIGDSATDSGYHVLKSSFFGLTGLVLPKGAPENPDGKRTHVKLFMPSPLNWVQALEGLPRYENCILKTFDGIKLLHVPLFPKYIRDADFSITVNKNMAYYSRRARPLDPPSELALIVREKKLSPGVLADRGHTIFTIEIWIFTKTSGATQQGQSFKKDNIKNLKTNMYAR